MFIFLCLGFYDLLFFQKLESLWQIIDDIRCDEALFAKFANSNVASKTVEIDTADASLLI